MGQDSQDWEPGGRGRLGLDHDGAVEGEEVGEAGGEEGSRMRLGLWSRDLGIMRAP